MHYLRNIEIKIKTKMKPQRKYRLGQSCLRAGHVITGNLKIISDSRIRSIIAKGPKYRVPVH